MAENKVIHNVFEDPSLIQDEEEKLKAFRNTRDEIKDWIQIMFTNPKLK